MATNQTIRSLEKSLQSLEKRAGETQSRYREMEESIKAMKVLEEQFPSAEMFLMIARMRNRMDKLQGKLEPLERDCTTLAEGIQKLRESLGLNDSFNPF